MVGEVYGWELSQRPGVQLRRPHSGLLRPRLRRADQLRLQARYVGVAGQPLHPRTRPRSARRTAWGRVVLNYLSSHDDGSPYDVDRKDPLGAGTRLLLAPGGAQIYYGDELARPLRIAGRRGRRQSALLHELGRPGARGNDEPGPGALAQARPLPAGPSGRRRGRAPDAPGRRRTSSAVRSRADGAMDRVLVAMDQGEGEKTIPVFGVFPEGTELVDAYSGTAATVTGRIRQAHDPVRPCAAIHTFAEPGSSRTLSSPAAGIASPSSDTLPDRCRWPSPRTSRGLPETLKAITAR